MLVYIVLNDILPRYIWISISALVGCPQLRTESVLPNNLRKISLMLLLNVHTLMACSLFRQSKLTDL
jgi:hypothetical protein